MFNVFKGALLALVREKSVFIWSLAFPLILSTMFVFMFANLDEAGQFEPIPTVVVADENYDAAPGFLGDDRHAGRAGSRPDARRGARGHRAGGARSHERKRCRRSGLLQHFGRRGGRILHGRLRRHAHRARESGGHTRLAGQRLPVHLEDHRRRVRAQRDAHRRRRRREPRRAGRHGGGGKLLDAGDLTEKIDVTQNPPKESVRYFFALLGMAALFGGQIG